MPENSKSYFRAFSQPQQQQQLVNKNYQNGIDNSAVEYRNNFATSSLSTKASNNSSQQSSLTGELWNRYTGLSENSKSSYRFQKGDLNNVEGSVQGFYYRRENPIISNAISSKSITDKKDISPPSNPVDFLQKEFIDSHTGEEDIPSFKSKEILPLESAQPFQTKVSSLGISTLRLPVPHGPSIAFDQSLPLLASRSLQTSNEPYLKSKFKTKSKSSAKASGNAASMAKSKANAWSNGKSSSAMSKQMAGNQQKLADMQQKVQDLRHHTYKGQSTSYGWGQGQGFGYGKSSYGRGGGHAWANDNWERQSPKPYRYPSPNNGNGPNQAPSSSAQSAPPPAVPKTGSVKVSQSQQQSSSPATANAASQAPQYLKPNPSKLPVASLGNKLSDNKKKPGRISDYTDHVFKKLKHKKTNYAQEQATGSGHGEGYGNKESWGQGGGYAWAGKAPPQGAPNPADFLQRPASLPVLPNVPGGSSGEGSYSNAGGVDSSGPGNEAEEQSQESAGENPQEQSQESPETPEQPAEASEQSPETPEQPEETPGKPEETSEEPEIEVEASADYYNKLKNNNEKIHKTYKSLKNKLKERFKNAANTADKLRQIKKISKTFQNNPWRSPRYDDND